MPVQKWFRMNVSSGVQSSGCMPVQEIRDSGCMPVLRLILNFVLTGLADQWQYARSKLKLKIISYSKNDNSAHIPGI